MATPIVFIDMKESAQRASVSSGGSPAPPPAALATAALVLDAAAAASAASSIPLVSGLGLSIAAARDVVTPPPPAPGTASSPPPVNGNTDPFFRAIRDQLVAMSVVPAGPPLLTHIDGKLDSQRVTGTAGTLTAQETILSAIFGVLGRDNQTNPVNDRFQRDVTAALAEYGKAKAVFDRALQVLITAGTASTESTVDARLWSAVARRLIEGNVPATDPHFDELATSILVALRGADGAQQSPSTISISLPDLEKQADLLIVADNLLAMQALYYSAMLEEMKLFEAMDTAVEQWQLGMLVLSRGRAGDKFYQYWRRSVDRFSTIERQSLYSRGFGLPGGDAVQGNPNREFKNLWLRFISSVSSFYRQLRVDNILRAQIPVPVSQEQVRQSGRDLAANLSLHGYGIAYFAATELQQQIKDIIELLSEREVKDAYGARDMFQVIEQVMLYQTGEAVSTVKSRVSANAGAIIIRWLADRSSVLTATNLQDVITIPELQNPPAPKPGTSPTTAPRDIDLVNAVEQWLAVNGVPEQDIMVNSQPSEPPRTPSRPIQVPSIARDLLENVGVSVGASAFNGNGHGARGYGARNGRMARG